MSDDILIFDIANVVPPTHYDQAFAAAVCDRVFAGDRATLDFMKRLLPATGIDKRHSVIDDYRLPGSSRVLLGPGEDFRPEPGTAARTQIFRNESRTLAIEASGRLFEGPLSALRPRITHLVTASCTGFFAPGFDLAVCKALALDAGVHRTHVGFMGCFAGFSTLKLAHAICRAEPDALVLIVHVELCTLHVRFQPDRDTLVANAIFSDGAAAALVGGAPLLPAQAPPPGLRLVGQTATVVPDSEDEMTWSVGDRGFEMRLSPRVPFLLRRHLPSAFTGTLDRFGVPREEVRHFAIHPGGPAILDKSREALSLTDDDVRASAEVLRDYGNMSSSTLWFLLDRVRRRPQPGHVFACGFGPGLTLETALLEHRGAS